MLLRHQKSCKCKESMHLHEVQGSTNLTYGTKTKENVDNIYYNVNSTIKMDDNLHRCQGTDELFYDVVQISTNKKSDNADDIHIDVNPSYNVSNAIEVDDDVHEVKQSASNIAQLSTETNRKSKPTMKKANPSYGVRIADCHRNDDAS